MLISNKVKINIHTKNIKKYPNTKIGDSIEVDVSELPRGSKYCQ